MRSTADDGSMPSRALAPFWLRSIGRRPAAFVSLFVLSALAVGVSVLAPTLLRSVQEVSLAEAAAHAGAADTAIIASADTTAGAAEGGFGAALQLALSVEHPRLWLPSMQAVATTSALDWRTPRGLGTTQVTAIGTSCAGTTILSGRCPRADGEVMLARSTAKGEAAAVGDHVILNPDDLSTRLRVVGIYDDRSGFGLFLSSPSEVTGGVASNPVVTLKTFDLMQVDGTAYAVRLLRPPLTLDTAPRARSDVEEVRAAAFRSGSAAFSARMSTGLIDVINGVVPQHNAATILLAVSAIQALALAWFAEALVIQRIARVRALEWGLARLRGLPRRRWLGTIFVEPLVAILVGGAVGFGAGQLVALTAVHAALGPATIIDPAQPLVLLAGCLALVGSIVALVVASLSSARLPLATLLRQTTEPRQLSRAGLVVQTAVILVTVVVLYSLVIGTRISGPQIALLAPSLVAVLLGLVALRVAVGVIRNRTRRPPRTLTGVVIGRQLGRTPSVLFTAMLVSVGIAIAVYSCQIAVVAVRLQDDRAAATLGAGTVLTVTVPRAASLVDAVRRADPSGRVAMAAEVYERGTGVGRLVAVDTSRLAAVAAWKTDWSGMPADRLQSRLAPAVGPSLTFTGTTISLTLSDLGDGRVPSDQGALRLDAVVQNETGWHDVTFGPPHAGVVSTDPGSLPCEGGCRLVWLGEIDPSQSPAPFSTQLTITAIATDTTASSDFDPWLDPSRWRNRIGPDKDSTQPANATVAAAPRGLRVVFTDSRGGNAPSIATRDTPEPLPALLGPKTPSDVFAGIPHAVLGIGIDSNPLLLSTIGHAAILPRSLGVGAMVDLELAERSSDPRLTVTSREVWLAPGEHPAIRAALEREHVHVTSTRSLDALAALYARDAPTLAARLGLVGGGAALLLVIVTVIAVRTVGVGRRRQDYDSLALAGVTAKRIRRLLALEVLVPTAAGVILGGIAGAIGVVLTAPKLPLLAGHGVTPPPDLALAWLPIALIAGVAVVAMALVGVLGARFERRAS
jgi:putative ABC transport system permease protein